ncbi:hypothetical protein BCV70DRAFT_81287 [Testicularia cyperi]|uniref:dolichol kinase n=1 Tax=Testicularia cyperi TaxID=1882483 RepID=A0A317XI20_9BASI|nr:hypothetical protein BCV70DRAFT_81287 [Testicularia cyperi]
MERTWSTDSVASIPERSIPDPARLRRQARRLSNQASTEGAREWRKSRANGNGNTNAKAGPSSRRLSHSNPPVSSGLRKRIGVDGASHQSLDGSHERQSFNGGVQRPGYSSLALGSALTETASESVSGSSTDRPRRRRSTTVESREAYSADPSASPGGRNGYASSTDEDPSSSDYEAFDWDVGRRKMLDRPKSIPNESLLFKALGGGASSGAKGPTPSSTGSSDRNGNTRNSKTVFGNGKLSSSPKKVPVQLPGEGPAATQSGRLAVPNGNASHKNSSGSVDKRHSSDASPAGANSCAVTTAADCSRASWKRLRINPTVEALLMIAASCAAYYGLRTHEKVETQSHAGEVGFVTIISVLYYFLRDPDEQAAIWATDHRNYRSCPEDGAINALLLPPLLASATLFSAIQDQAAGRSSARASGEALPNPPWIVEGPAPILNHNRKLPGGMTTLVVSRYSLVSLMCMTSTIMLCHLLATKFIRKPHQFPKSNWAKLRSFTAFASVVAVFLEVIKEVAANYNFPLWGNLARWEVVTAALVFQANLYTISRLARKSFTMGELGIVASVGITLSMETLHLFVAKLLPVTTPYVKTFRRPTPLLIFQLALIVGTFMVGFLLSPLLYLSRNLAQKPTHRLRWPDKRDLHRRLLAGFFYLFATIYVVGVLGMWVRWMLVKRDPWIWTATFLLKGQKPWSRLALVGYWLLLVSVSISCWQAVVANAKRFRGLGNSYSRNHSSKASNAVNVAPASDAPGGVEIAEPTKRNSGVHLNLNTLGGSASALAKEHNTAAIKKAAHLSLNARRKFFHALAVALFVPGIALDPAFSHLAFSLAFSIFIFAEYVRYYALYPFGAALHVFMSEFLDHKDSGPVILSHFYLLTGCAGPLWLEGNSRIMHQTGVLVLGVGDSLASVIGRRYGRLYWAGSSKTVEGSLAFFTSILASAWLLRFFGLTEFFDMRKYSFVIAILGLLEGVSDQHDNLLLPIFAYIVGSLVGI